MNKLSIELARLYGLHADATDPPLGAAPADLRGPGVRAAVLAVLRPAGWPQLAAAWHGVQSDLELPAPAIALSGSDAWQLWFSFASPVPVAQASRFLEGLRERYLPDVAPARVRAVADPSELPTPPCIEVDPQRWSAFVTRDLASIFEETPSLDVPPSDEGQASILRALEPIRPAAFDAAMRTIGAAPVARTDALKTSAEAAGSPPPAAFDHLGTEAAGFLASVMNDPSAPLALRVEAAGLLLAHRDRR